MKQLNSRASRPVTALDILNFFRQLSTLLAAGLSLMKSLELVLQTHDKPRFRALVQALRRELESGKEWSRCLRRYPQFFDLFCCQLVQIGEQTGKLELMLKRIATYKEKNHQLKKELRQALLYPALLLLAALLTTLLLLLFVVPQFAAIFEHFPNKIPAATRALIQLAWGLRQPGLWFALLGLGAAAALFCGRHPAGLRQRCQRLAFQLPFLRELALKISLAKFSRNLATMLSAGLPLTEGLMLISRLTPDEELTRACLKSHAGVNSGQRLAASLRLHPLFPPMLIQLVTLGEESGTLDLMLEKFAEIYENDYEETLNTLKLLLEPLIIAILGVLIGIVVLAMYLPIFRLGTAI